MKLFANAVLAKELRSRMRIWKTPALIVVYLLLLGLIGYGVVAILQAEGTRGLMEPESGLYLYSALALFQLGLITLVAPALTVSQVSGERDRQTFDLLLTTRMSSTGIIFGKFAAALAFMLVLIVASVPVYSLVFLFGGVGLKQLGITFVVYFAVMLVYGAIGLCASVLFRRTQGAVVASYAAVLFLLIGTLLVQAMLISLNPPVAPAPGQLPPPQIPWLYYLNPFIALGSALPGPVSAAVSEMFFTLYRYAQPWPGGPVPPMPGPGVTPTPPSLSPLVQLLIETPPWVVFLVFSALLFAGLMTMAVLYLSPVRPWARRRLLRRTRAAGPPSGNGGTPATAGAAATAQASDPSGS